MHDDESRESSDGQAGDDGARLWQDTEFLSSLDSERCPDRFCAHGKLVPVPAGRTRWFRPTALLGHPGGPILHLLVTRAVEFEWETWHNLQTTPQYWPGPYPRRPPRSTAEKVEQYLSWFDRDAEGLAELAEVVTIRAAYELECAVATNRYLGRQQWEDAARESDGEALCDLARRMMMMTISDCPARLDRSLAPVEAGRPPAQRHCTRQAVTALELRRPGAVVCHGGDAWFWLREVLESAAPQHGFRLEWSQAEGALPCGTLCRKDGSVTRLAAMPVELSEHAEALTAVTVLHNIGYDVA